MSLIKHDAEATLLGGLIVRGGDTILAYSDKLLDSYFGYEPNQIIWQKLKEMAKAKASVDIITLKESLPEASLQAIGGAKYLASLIAGVPDDPKVETYYTIVAEFAARRKYKELGEGLARAAECAPSLADVEQAAYDLKIVRRTGDVPSVESASEAAMERIISERKSGFDLQWGIKDLDALMGGLARKKMSVVGAKTSHGKTTVFCNVALHNLETRNDTKLLYSGVENIDDIPIKLAAMQSGIPLDWFVKPSLINEEQLDQCLNALSKLATYKDRLLIVSGAGPSNLRQIASSYRPDIICLDYIQRFAISSGKDDIRAEVNKMAAEMQQLAIDYSAHSIIMSQIKRLQEDRKRGAPDIGDLKESGDLENFADNIVMAWWPWRDTMQDSKYQQTEYHLNVGKNKLGPCLNTKAYFNLKTMRIVA